jgi:hypothetical protein
MKYTIRLFGDQATQTPSSAIQKKFEETKELKESALEFMRVMVERKDNDLANKDANISDTTIKGFQRAWRTMSSKKAKDMTNVQQRFWRFTQPGLSDLFPLHWDRKMEAFVHEGTLSCVQEGYNVRYQKGLFGAYGNKSYLEPL